MNLRIEFEKQRHPDTSFIAAASHIYLNLTQ